MFIRRNESPKSTFYKKTEKKNRLPCLSKLLYIKAWFFPSSQDGYLEGELLDGRKGLVPSNLIERLSGEDLLEFHQSCVLGVQEEDIW